MQERVKGVAMDDLDHSVHIAERDWHRFYEETEECCLLPPALAGQDDSGLSDSEDSGRPVCPVPDSDQRESKQSSEPEAEGLREAEQGWLLPLQTHQSGPGDTSPEPGNGPPGREVDHSGENTIIAELIMGKSAEQDAEVKNTSVKPYVKDEAVHDECSASGSSNDVGDSISGPVDGSHNASALTALEAVGEERQREAVCSAEIKNVNLGELRCPDGATRGRGRRDAPGVEKERWFVTINDRPVRLRPNAGQKKKRKKKRRSSVRRAECMSESQDPPDDSGPEIETDGMNSSEGKDITLHTITTIFLDYSNPTHVSDLTQITLNSSPPPLEDEPSLELPLETTNSPKSVPIESFTDSENSEIHCSAVSSDNTVTNGASATHDGIGFTPGNENAPQTDGIDSEHLKDDTELFSTDSEDYISAAESEEPQNNAQYNISQMTPSLSHYSLSASSGSLITDANLQPPAGEDCPHCASPQQGESYESTADLDYIEPAKLCASYGHSDRTKPEDSSETTMEEHRDDNSPLTDYETLSRANVAREIASSPPLPVLTVTPFSATEGPETFTDALCPTRPVYAISSFWDEMEKLTIKDILQLRSRARSPSPMREAHNLQPTERTQVDGNMEDSSITDKADDVLPDGPLVDTSDTADSDYFTHVDDSKRDRSSCEFSTFSDFDEEYYSQFLGTSTDPSPEPQDVKLQSEKKADPVDVEQLPVQHSDDCIHNTILSDDDNTFLRGLTKSKSLRDVHAFGTEMRLRDASLNSISEDAERTLILSTHQTLQDNSLIGANGGITRDLTRTPSPIITNTDILDECYQICYPEVFEHLFVDDEPKDSSQTRLSVYETQRISVPDMYDYSAPECGAGVRLPTFQELQSSEEEPVAIFSCSRSAARDLAFPELEYLLFPQDDTNAQSEEGEEEDSGSPIRAVTRNDTQAKPATSSVATEGHRLLVTSRGRRGDWRSSLSLRGMCFSGDGISWSRGSGARMSPPVPQESLKPVEMNQAVETINETRITSLPTAMSSLQVVQVGQLCFRELAEQRRFKAMPTTFSEARKDDLLFTLKQSDMCLVCIAFAAWVLKSTDSQAADAWKTVLLANVSAISAIQYLRRYVRRRRGEEL